MTTRDQYPCLNSCTLPLATACPVSLPICLICFEPLLHLLHLSVPIRPQPEPDAHCRAVYERHCQAIPQSMEPHVASERHPEPDGNTCPKTSVKAWLVQVQRGYLTEYIVGAFQGSHLAREKRTGLQTYLIFNRAPVNYPTQMSSLLRAKENVRKRTCFPRALSIPPETPLRPSNTWNRATTGRIDATSLMTSVAMVKTMPSA